MNLHKAIMNLPCNYAGGNAREYREGHATARHAAAELALAADKKIERLRADRDCEKRLRKDSDDLATDLRQALEALIACPTDTELAHAVLQRIHGAEVKQVQALMTDARELATCYVSLAQQVRLIARDGATPDGDEVNSPTLLWAEGWLRKLDAAL